MVKIIERHEVLLSNFEGIQDRIAKGLEKIKNKYIPKFNKSIESLAFESVSNDLLKMSFYSEFLKNSNNISYSFLYYCNLFAVNAYKYDYNNDKEKLSEDYLSTEETVLRNVRDIKLLGHKLTDYIELALLLRDKEAIAFYTTIELRKNIPGRIIPIWDRDLEKLLVLLCRDDTKLVLNHLTEMKNTNYLDPTIPFFTGYHAELYIEKIFEPIFDVYIAVFNGDEKRFNETLFNAVRKHKAYYESRDEYNESRTGLPEGWVSLAITAACALAHDRGIKREVQSDYIPEWLVRGEFEGLRLIVE